MKELTEENYNYLTPNFEGIIVSIPTTIGYNADLYIYGNKINEDNKLEISCMAYNMEDGAINGFSYVGNTNFQSIFRDFKYMKHYEFENLSEFCNWYLHKDDKLHESIDNFIKDTQKFYSKPKMTRREKYQDVLKLFMYQYELMELQTTLDMAEGYWDKQEAQDRLEQKQEEFENWLDEEVIE